MLIGARLNWLLGHGNEPSLVADGAIHSIDIQATEMDSNRAIAAPVVGDIASSVAALLARLEPDQIQPRSAWLAELAKHRQQNAERMAAHLAATPRTDGFLQRARRHQRRARRQAGHLPRQRGGKHAGYHPQRHRHVRRRASASTLGPGGSWAIGMGYAIGAAVVSGKPVVAIEGDSAFGFSGMEIETICRYHLPIVIVVFNNGGIYRGDDVNRGGGADPGPTVLMKEARYEKLIEAFGGVGYYAVDPRGLASLSPMRSPREAGPDQLRDRSQGGDGERPHRQPQPAKQHPTAEVRAVVWIRGLHRARRRAEPPGQSLPRETRGAVMEATTLAHLLADTTSAQPPSSSRPSGVEISYRALADEVERLAEDFGGAGLQAGDAVALWSCRTDPSFWLCSWRWHGPTWWRPAQPRLQGGRAAWSVRERRATGDCRRQRRWSRRELRGGAGRAALDGLPGPVGGPCSSRGCSGCAEALLERQTR